MRTASLRRRLTLVSLGVLLIAIAIFGAFLYDRMDAGLTADLDQRLIDRAGLAKLLDGSLRAQQLADRLAGAGISATVRANGVSYAGKPQPPPKARPAQPPPPPRAPATTVTRITRTGATLTLVQPLRDGSLVLRADRGQIDSDLRRLLALEISGALVIMALAGLALTVLVRRATAPLDEMTRVASTIAAGRSGQRLNPSRSDTELGRMASAFDAMLDSLEEAADQARRSEVQMREFLSDVSHELRTPITGLMVSAETLLREDEGWDEERELRLVMMIRQTERAGRLIDDLLTLSRLEHGDGLACEPFDLTAVVRQEAERTRLLAPTLDVTVVAPDRCAMVGDRDRIAQVIANLLDNARHATADGGAIALALHDDGASVQLEVTDTGRGVPAGERERIFDRLVRLDASRTRERFGGGLGLPISRLIAQAHGGALWCAGHAPGACFVLRLPRTSAAASPPVAPAPAEDSLSDGRTSGLVQRGTRSSVTDDRTSI